jgi:type I restriction enzyme S subunit
MGSSTLLEGELPEGWKSSKLGYISSRITKGSTPTSYGFEFLKKGINFVKVENISAGNINLDSIKQFISTEANT